MSHRNDALTGLVMAVLLAAALLATDKLARADAVGNVDLPRYPAVSPDGSKIVFSWRGDLWIAPTRGGDAIRLTRHDGDDLHAAWSADGSRIAFTSTRSGYLNIHLMEADGTDIRQVTDIDVSCTLAGFGVDERGREVITFHASLENDVYGEPRPYMISTGGGDFRRMHDAFGAQPRVADDGQRIVFRRGGSFAGWSRRHYRGPDNMDVWLFDRRDGSFNQLTTFPGNDGDARWGGERTLLYLSDRELDCINLHRMSAEDGQNTSIRLTAFTEHDVHGFDVSADGSLAVLAVWDTLYRLDLDDPNASPEPIALEAPEDDNDRFELKPIDREVTEAALSPDGEVMAVIAYGEVYIRNVADGSPTRRVTDNHAHESDLAWSPDGLKLYFTSDRNGRDAIYAATVKLTRGEVKEAFEEASAEKAEETDEEDVSEPSSPPAEGAADDGAAPGDASGDSSDSGDSGDEPPGDEEDDSADKKEKQPLPRELQPERWHDALTFTIELIVAGAPDAREPSPSPDGRHLVFGGTRGDVHIVDLDSGERRPFIKSWDPGMQWRWSPDSTLIAYAQSDLNFNRDIFIAPVDGSWEPVNITRHPDDDSQPRFSADGKVLTFISERINEEFDVWMVYLDKDLEALTDLELKAYYEEAAKAAKKRKPLKITPPAGDDPEQKQSAPPSEADGADDNANAGDDTAGEPYHGLDLDDAYRRVRRVTALPGHEFGNEITPAGDRIIFIARGESPGLYSIKYDGSDQKRLAGPVSVQHVSLTGDKLVVVSSSQAATIKPDGGSLKTTGIRDRIRIDLEEQSSQKFLEAARVLGEQYYHPTMNGLNWPALTEAYHALARRARTVDEFNWIANRFVGELNGSHLGVRARRESSPNRQSCGRLGTTHRRAEGGFQITGILPESPAAIGPMALKIGDVITAIQFTPIRATDTVESLLKGRVGEETVLSITRTMDDGDLANLDVLLTPISSRSHRALRYRAWRQDMARLVDQWSGGRIGYIHIQSMNQRSLDVYERDLFAAANGRDGLIIDVRDNGGGSTADLVLSSIMVREHAYTVPRGADWSNTGHYPQDRLYIQRYTLPINMMCNQKSFSNAEIIAHAFKTLGRGTLVGQQTHGSVISTGGFMLIDGTFVRLPFRGWFVSDGQSPGALGTNMELHGAMPDLVVEQTPQAECAGVDEQLRAAVDDLLERLR